MTEADRSVFQCKKLTTAAIYPASHDFLQTSTAGKSSSDEWICFDYVKSHMFFENTWLNSILASILLLLFLIW